MIKLGNSLGHGSIPAAFNWIVDPLVLNPFLYFDGAENVTTAGGAVSSWGERSAGTNQLDRTLAQGTASLQPANTTEKSVDFDGTDDKLAFDVAVAQAGVLICATNNGIFAYEVDADSVAEITALGVVANSNFFDLDLFAMVLLPTTTTDTQIAGVVKYLERETGATKNPTGDVTKYWQSRYDIVSPKFDGLDWSGVTEAYNTWHLCNALTSFPSIDLSNCTAFSYTWAQCSNLTSFPALDMTSCPTFFNVTWGSCSSMASFGHCTFSTNPSHNLYFGQAWQHCSSLTSFPALDLSRGTTFANTWHGCTGLTSFPDPSFSTSPSDSLNFSSAWEGCTALETFPALNLSRGTTFLGAWKNCTSLTSFLATGLVSSWDFYTAWSGCTSLVTFPAIPLTGGTRFQNTWQGCTAMTTFLATDLDSGTNFGGAWNGCSALTAMPAIDFTACTSFSTTWYQCSSLTSFPAVSLDSGNGFYYCWSGCSSLTDFPANVFDNWSPASISNNCFVGAWGGCTSLTATSVENILNSIATAGVAAPSSGVTITIVYNASSGTPNIASAVATLKGLSPAWIITLNGVAQ
jgi:hypothetical protein